MSLWNLDPRQAGVTEPDVDTFQTIPGNRWHVIPVEDSGPAHNHCLCDITFDTEAAALRAAREAAGLAHVAEQPCAQMQYTFSDGDLDCIETPDDECEQCGWLRDRHGKGR